MCDINKLYIKCFCDENTIVNKPENIPMRFLPNDYSKDKYTIIEKYYLIDTNNSFTDYYIESNYDTCYLCKCTINYFDIENKYEILKKNLQLNDIILNKLKEKVLNKNNNNLFIFQSKMNYSSYIYYHYHLCETCYKHSLYYWSISNKNKYPSSRVDGYRFINENDKFVPEVKKKETVEIINKLNIPNIYICDFYNCENNNYNYLD